MGKKPQHNYRTQLVPCPRRCGVSYIASHASRHTCGSTHPQEHSGLTAGQLVKCPTCPVSYDPTRTHECRGF